MIMSKSLLSYTGERGENFVLLENFVLVGKLCSKIRKYGAENPNFQEM